MKLFRREFNHGLLATGPGKPVCLESFHQEPEPGAIIKKKFHAVAFAIVEPEDGSREWVKLHRLLDQCHERVQSGAEVDRLAMQVHQQVMIEAEHQCAPSAAIIALTSEASRPEHSSSTTTQLGSVADRRAADAGREGWNSARRGVDCGSRGTVTLGALWLA